jgi:hypothetical protein
MPSKATLGLGAGLVLANGPETLIEQLFTQASYAARF